MKRIGKFLILSILVGFGSHSGYTGDGKVLDKSAKWQVLAQSVQEILTGATSDQTTVRVAPGAQLAIGDTLVSLSDVVGGKVRLIHFSRNQTRTQ